MSRDLTLHSSSKDWIVGFTGWFANTFRLPNFTGATVRPSFTGATVRPKLYRCYGAAETLPVLRCALQTVQRLEYVCPANVDAQLPSAVAGVESCLRKANTTTVRHATLLDALGTSLAWQPALRAAAESDAGLNGWIEHFFEAAAAADATFSDPMSVTQLMTAQVRLSAALVASDVGHAAHDGSYAPQRNVACIRCRSRSS